MTEKSKWIGANAAYELAKIKANSIGGLSEPIGRRIIRLSSLGKVQAVCKRFLTIERLSPDEQTLQKQKQRELREDEFVKWRSEKHEKVYQERAKGIPEYVSIPSWFWSLLLEGQLGSKYAIAPKTHWNAGIFTCFLGNEKLPFTAEVDEILAGDNPGMFFAIDTYFSANDIIKIGLTDTEFDEIPDSTSTFSSNMLVEIEETPLPKSSSSAPSSPPMAKKGGRRGAQHGEPIARLTKQMMQVERAELKRYTAESLAEELKFEYERIGENPPSHPNLVRYSQGILRVMRL